MRPGSAGLLVVVAAWCAAGSPSASAGDGDGKKDDLRFAPGPARDPAFQKSVDDAIARGVAWMRDHQGKDGVFGDDAEPFSTFPFGYTSLGVHVLRSCGASFDDPAVAKGIATMRQAFRSGGSAGAQTYQLALALLALEAHYSPDAAPEEKKKSRYGDSAKRGKPVIPASDLEWIRAMAQRLCSAQDASGAFGYTATDGYSRRRSGWDHSNTQYALLGLKAARRCGVEIDARVFQNCLEHLLGTQEPSGPEVERRETDSSAGDAYAPRSRVAGRDRARGWGYTHPGATGSMTTGGVSSMVICRGELQGTKRYTAALDRKAVQSIRDGIAWLGRNFSVTDNPPSGTGGWHYYYLYGLERAGVLAGVTWMAEHDWYLEGAKYLLAQQNGDGSWGGTGMLAAQPRRKGARARPGNLLDTAFALLFLKKATFRVEGAVATEESDSTLDLSGAAALDDASFRAVFDSVFARYARAAEKDRSVLAADFVRMGTRALGLLILTLEAEGAAERGTALDALRRVTGLTHGYDPAAPQEARSAAVATWEEWYFGKKARLVADGEGGRFREGGR